MKFLNFILFILLFNLQAQAKTMSSCDHHCFDQKYNCNIYKSHTYNTCEDDLFTCRASCKSGKKQNDYSTPLLMDVSFHPTVEIDPKVLVGSIHR